jgi:multiple sugar transport system permease protein
MIARKSVRSISGRCVTHLILGIGSIIMMILPFVWMISTSLKPLDEVFVYPPQWIPKVLCWQNYIDAWNAAPFGRYLLNTVIIATLTTLGRVINCSFCAYAFARLRFPGRNILFMMVLATMMIPQQVVMIPVFYIMKVLGWINTFQALIVPGLANAWGIFLLRQFFMTIPTELEDAGRIDGCSRTGILLRIFIPLAKPALMTLVLFSVLWTWNSFVWPLILTNSDTVRPIQLGLAMFRGEIGQSAIAWTKLMAASVFATLPIFVVFLLGQRHFVGGIMLSGLKG